MSQLWYHVSMARDLFTLASKALEHRPSLYVEACDLRDWLGMPVTAEQIDRCIVFLAFGMVACERIERIGLFPAK